MADSNTPTPAMDPEHEALLFELKHHRVFPALDNSTYLHNPYILAMIKIQSFTQTVTTLLEQSSSPQQGLVSAIRDLYDGLPSFHEQLAFGKWLKDAMLKHPHSETVSVALRRSHDHRNRNFHKNHVADRMGRHKRS
jgi:hypothetical protein